MKKSGVWWWSSWISTVPGRFGLRWPRGSWEQPQRDSHRGHSSAAATRAPLSRSCATKLHYFNILRMDSTPFLLKIKYLLMCGCLFRVKRAQTVLCQRALMKSYRLTWNIFNNSCICVCVWGVRGPMEPDITPTCSRDAHRSISIRTGFYCLACQNISRGPNPIDLLCASLRLYVLQLFSSKCPFQPWTVTQIRRLLCFSFTCLIEFRQTQSHPVFSASVACLITVSLLVIMPMWAQHTLHGGGSW